MGKNYDLAPHSHLTMKNLGSHIPIISTSYCYMFERTREPSRKEGWCGGMLRWQQRGTTHRLAQHRQVPEQHDWRGGTGMLGPYAGSLAAVIDHGSSNSWVLWAQGVRAWRWPRLHPLHLQSPDHWRSRLPSPAQKQWIEGTLTTVYAQRGGKDSRSSSGPLFSSLHILLPRGGGCTRRRVLVCSK